MSKKNDNQPLHEVIHEGNKWIKNVEKQLSRLDKLRKKVSLDKNACTKIVLDTSASEPTFLEAQKELQKLDVMSENAETPQKQNRRKRLGRAIHRKLQI